MSLTVFAPRIRELRQSKNLTQKEFAEKVGITAATLSSYETGEKYPSLLTADKIACTYGASLDWLCGIEDKDDALKTKGDLIRYILKLCEHGTIEAELNGYDNDEFGYIVETVITYHIYGDWAEGHFDDYNKMSALLEKGAISQEIFNTWQSSALEKLDAEMLENNVPISLIPF